MNDPSDSLSNAVEVVALHSRVHVEGIHANPPKCTGGLRPLTITEFSRLLDNTPFLGGLTVDNVTHWKEDSFPLYHEFVTVKTAPYALAPVDSTTLPILERWEANQPPFDWDTVRTHGVSFRIDRGQRRPEHLLEHGGLFSRDPLDLIEVLLPGELPVPDGVHNVFENEDLEPVSCHISLNWSGYFPLLTFDRQSTPPAGDNDAESFMLQVRDFLYFLQRHAEQARIYHLLEWNCWGLASSIIRFIQHYSLDFNMTAFAFPGDSLPLKNEDWAVEAHGGHMVLTVPKRMKIRRDRAKARSFEGTIKAEYWQDRQVVIDEELFKQDDMPTLDQNLFADLGVDLGDLVSGLFIQSPLSPHGHTSFLEMPQRGHVGYLRSHFPLASHLEDSNLALNLQHSLNSVTRWVIDLTHYGLLNELLAVVGAVSRRSSNDSVHPEDAFWVPILVEFLKERRTGCVDRMREFDTFGSFVAILESSRVDASLKEATTTVLVELTNSSEGLTFFADGKCLPAMFQTARELGGDGLMIDHTCLALAYNLSEMQETLLRAGVVPWAVELCMNDSTRWPDTLLKLLMNLVGATQLSMSAGDTATLKSPRFVHYLVQLVRTHPNPQFKRPIEQSRTLRRNALWLLEKLTSPKEQLGAQVVLDQASVTIVGDVFKDKRITASEARVGLLVLAHRVSATLDTQEDKISINTLRAAVKTTVRKTKTEMAETSGQGATFAQALDSLGDLGAMFVEIVRAAKDH